MSRISLLIVLMMSWPPAIAGGQELATATATDRDCDRAYVLAVHNLLRQYGARLVEMRSREDTRINKGGDHIDLSVETQSTLGALLRSPFVRYHRSSGKCVAVITITTDELAQAQSAWIQQKTVSAEQQAVLDRLQKIDSHIESLRADRSRPTFVAVVTRRDRLPLWPFALGMVGAAAGGAAMGAQEYRLHEEMSRGSSKADLERIIAARDKWRMPTLVSAGAAIGYLVVRAAVNSTAANRLSHLALGIERRRFDITWRSRIN